MNITPSRYAGHSKWSNIKHKKAHKDNARAKVFGKLSLEIIQAVKGKLFFHMFVTYRKKNYFVNTFQLSVGCIS